MNRFIIFIAIICIVTFLIYYYSYKNTNLTKKEVKQNSIIATILDLLFWF